MKMLGWSGQEREKRGGGEKGVKPGEGWWVGSTLKKIPSEGRQVAAGAEQYSHTYTLYRY